MRAVISIAPVLAVLCACDGAPDGARQRYISIGADALSTARDVTSARGEEPRVLGIDASAEVAGLAVDDGDLEALSEQMHERHGRCGGFMLHESLEDARASLRPPAERAVDYTLDQAAIVRDLLPALDPAKILATI